MREPLVIVEDQDILVLDKPSGMTVNRAETTKGERTVQEWVEEKLKTPASPAGRQNSKLKTEESDYYKRAGIVHRLDKETSGVLIVAKTLQAFENLQLQFKERLVKKTYTALVHGRVESEEGEIRVPVGRLPWNRKRFGVVAGGREAVTKYQVLGITYYVSRKRREPLSLLELYPETGRTHQIRVHLKYFGHPVFSDELYAGRKTARNDRKLLPRLFLHASKISFTHPRTAERVSCESPLSPELKKFLREFEGTILLDRSM